MKWFQSFLCFRKLWYTSGIVNDIETGDLRWEGDGSMIQPAMQLWLSEQDRLAEGRTIVYKSEGELINLPIKAQRTILHNSSDRSISNISGVGCMLGLVSKSSQLSIYQSLSEPQTTVSQRKFSCPRKFM